MKQARIFLHFENQLSFSVVRDSLSAVQISFQKANIVGSFGSLDDLLAAQASELTYCDVLEIRLDILRHAGWQLTEKPWQHLLSYPLLFTARVQEEGGVLHWSDDERKAALIAALPDAAAIDIEIHSAQNFSEIITLLQQKNIPWIASYHDFQQVPTSDTLANLLTQSVAKNAHVFKVAAQVKNQQDIEALTSFQKTTSRIFISTMGMGVLAETSRLQCAAAGSVLNYGFIGKIQTAPGQCTAYRLAKNFASVLE